MASAPPLVATIPGATDGPTRTSASGRHAGLRVALLFLITLPPLLVGHRDADCVDHMEAHALGSSQENWQRFQTDPRAWIIPTWNGEPRIKKPPLLIWIHLAAWSTLPRDASVETLLHRARGAAALAALVALLATAGAGFTLGGARLGTASAGVMASSYLFIHQGRLATYDIYLLASCTLCVALGLWALNPMHPAPRGRGSAWGWPLAGLALGAGVLIKGPLALLMGGAPLLLIALSDSRRRSHLRGLLAMLVVSALVALPWYLLVLHEVPMASAQWHAEFAAQRPHPRPPWHYVGLVGLVLPWCFWLPLGLVNGLRSRLEAGPLPRRVVLIWFLLIFGLLSLYEAKKSRYILPILPAASVLVAMQMLRTTTPTATRRLATLHTGLLGLLSLALGGLGVGQSLALARGWLPHAVLTPLPPYVWLALTTFLLAVALRGHRLLLRGHGDAALWVTAIWMALAATPALWAHAQSPEARYPHREAVCHLANLTREAPLFHLTGPLGDPRFTRPDPRFLVYTRRIVPGLSLEALQRCPGPAWVTAPQHPVTDQALREYGWALMLEFKDSERPRCLYFKHPLPATSTRPGTAGSRAPTPGLHAAAHS